ncbi:MAG: short-chain dehydrogenase [Rhodospirillales bacterium]|nr:short-chain dehydrogenase [Rhodospirillales bacterium]
MLTGYSVLITGAAEGLGRGIALAAGSAGASVVVSALNQAGAQDVGNEIRVRGGIAIAIACDVTQRADIEAAVAVAKAEFGRLDAFVHNANDSGAGARAVEEIADRDWNGPVAVGLRPIFFAAQAVLPALVESQGSMVLLTSPAAIDGTATLPVYSAVKGAQRALAKSLAREWGPLGVRVNAVSPSAVTPALAAYLEREPHMRPHMLKRAALRRMGDAEHDIGRALNFLIGRDARFMTGQTLIVSGGAMML